MRLSRSFVARPLPLLFSSLLSSLFTSLHLTSLLSTSSSLLFSVLLFLFLFFPATLASPSCDGRQTHVVQCNAQVLRGSVFSVLRISTFAPHLCRSTSTPYYPLAAAFDIAHLLLAPSSIRPFNSPQSVLGAFSFVFLSFVPVPYSISDPSCHPLPDADASTLDTLRSSGHPNIIAALPRQPAPPSAPRPATTAAPAHSLRSDHYRSSNDDDDDFDFSTLPRPTGQLIVQVALSLALLFWHPACPTRPLMIPFRSLLVLFIYPV